MINGHHSRGVFWPSTPPASLLKIGNTPNFSPEGIGCVCGAPLSALKIFHAIEINYIEDYFI
jgi:hypothetical protein